MLCEMQSVWSKIWTCVALSNSYDDNHYTTGTPKEDIWTPWAEWSTPNATTTKVDGTTMTDTTEGPCLIMPGWWTVIGTTGTITGRYCNPFRQWWYNRHGYFSCYYYGCNMFYPERWMDMFNYYMDTEGRNMDRWGRYCNPFSNMYGG